MHKDTILTGLRANNDLTLGNYFGGILPMIDMASSRADEFNINMFIPDLHSFTTPIDHTTLYEQILHTARLFVAAGLPIDHPNIHLYRQSRISAHSEATWILDCFTGMGEMNRMTQFKDKSGAQDAYDISKTVGGIISSSLDKLQVLEDGDRTEYDKGKSLLYHKLITDIHESLLANMDQDDNSSRVSVGLFNYPVLMAADILLYNAKYVPVGEDQTQHLEFTRDIAERINNKFGNVFTIPEAVPAQYAFFGKEKGLRIMDLITPTKKMSKSDESGRGVIFLGDTPQDAAKKIMSATTDDKANVAYDRANQPGITNLLEILSLLRNQPTNDTVAEFAGETRYGDFKKVVAAEVETFLTDFQARLQAVDNNKLHAKLEESEAAMTTIANETLLRLQKAVGLRN